MNRHVLSHLLRVFLPALATILTAAALVITILFTDLGPQWTTFLSGVLVAASLAEASRVSRSEWALTRRTSQISLLKEKLEHEELRRIHAEKAVSDNRELLKLIDTVLPTMIAFVNREGRLQYHNRAFSNMLHLRADEINGQHIRDVLGNQVYRETASEVRQALGGKSVHFERTQEIKEGTLYRFSVDHIPQFGDDGNISGFHILMNDITMPEDIRTNKSPQSSDEQNMFVDAYAKQSTVNHDSDMIKMAIENGDFVLFCQRITPLDDTKSHDHYEVLLRLREEEGSMLPPGSFFPLAEKYGLMPRLDRWVVQHVAEWIASQTSQVDYQDSIFFINVAVSTIMDSGFPEFLRLTLFEFGLPGTRLCFEISDSSLAAFPDKVAEFARKVKQCDCHVALSGFGREQVLFNLIRGFRVEFLKIDGSIILGIPHDPARLAKVVAINQVAKKIGVQIIAEMVENEETINKLKEIRIDYAQGFGISKPQQMM